MRPRIILLLPALALALFAQSAAFAAPAASATPFGIVLQAKNAIAGSSAAQSGSTVYDGDSLVTGQKGSLQVRFGGSQAYLLPQSTAEVHQSDPGFHAILSGGTILVSSDEGSGFQLLVDGATIQPATSRRTVAQVTLVSPKELLLLSSRGSIQVTMGEETKTLTEGNSVRMLIQPGAAMPAVPAPQASPWSPTITYSRGDVVSYNGVVYASATNNNLGNTPGRGGAWNRGGGNTNNRRGAAAGPGGQNNFLWVAIGLVGAGIATALALALITNTQP